MVGHCGGYPISPSVEAALDAHAACALHSAPVSTVPKRGDFMRWITVLLLGLCFSSLSGCQVFRDALFGGLSEKYDSSRPPCERRAAYDAYVRDNVDR
jgi:hypothetical protein